jgi:1-phosphofructokinase
MPPPASSRFSREGRPVILTVTPNPSLDRTVFVDALERGAVIRARRTRTEPSGKGVNVALALHRLGFDARAVVAVGGALGEQVSRLLRDAGLHIRAVAVAGETRCNLSIVEPDGTVTKVNEPGPDLSVAEITALVDAVREELAGADRLAVCGSLPAGAPEDLLARLVILGHEAGVPVAVDSSGPALRAALAAGPDLVAPNAFELAELVERPLHTLGEIVDAAAEIRERGVGAVLVSLGGDGAVLVDEAGAVHAEAPVTRVVSAVGAGDALLAGFLSAQAAGAPVVDALVTALRWAAAAVGQEGTLLSHLDPDQPVVVHRALDRSRRLRGT